MSNICGCSRPVRDGLNLCDTCRAELEQHLAEMSWLAEQLDISLTRIKGVNYNRQGGKSAETSLPWNDRAARARETLKGEMVSWVLVLRTSADKLPKDDLVQVAAWLLGRLDTITKNDQAWNIYDTITLASLQARSLVFAKPPERLFIGPCEGEIIDDGGEIVEVECPGEIYALDGAPVAECDCCLRAYDTAEAIRLRDYAIADRLLTAREIADLAWRTFGQPQPRVINLIRSWHKRSRILPHGTTEDGQPTFQYGHVRDMLVEVYGDAS